MPEWASGRAEPRIEVAEEPRAALASYAEVSIAFEVDRALEVREKPVGGFALAEHRLAEPYVKDYDAIEGAGPWLLPERFDVSRWGVLVALVGGRRVGGAILAFDTPEVALLEGRRDVALLWDLRVTAELRGHGIGSALFGAAEAWARERGCRELEVETQNVNAPACRFYARHGCTLRAIDRFAYPELPHEVQLIWNKRLEPGRTAA